MYSIWIIKTKIGSEELITTVELGYNELDGTS
jgi:hypothetical protein